MRVVAAPADAVDVSAVPRVARWRAGWFEPAAVFVLVAAGHALGTAVVYRLSHVPSIGVTFFPASGVTVAALLLVSRRLRPFVLYATYAAELGSHFVLGERVVSGFGLAFADTLSPAIAAFLVWRWVGGCPVLSRRSHLVAFVVGGVLVEPFIDSVIGPPFARMNAVHGSYLATMARWWTGDGLGVLVVGSLLLAWLGHERWPVRPRHPVAEAAILGAGLVGLTWLVFWKWPASPVYLTIPVLGWAALRFGTRGATVAGVTVTAMAEWATLGGHGAFAATARQPRETGLWLLQLFLAVVVLAALVLAAYVSELGEAVSAAQLSEEQYRRIFEVTGDGLVIAELPTGRLVEVNPAFCGMHGYSREELIGSLPTVFVHPEDHPLFTDFVDAVAHGVRVRGRARDVTKDGRVFEIEARGYQVPFRGRPHILGVVRDISEEAAAYRLLEDRVADRTRELGCLLVMAEKMASAVSLEEIPLALDETAGGIVKRSTFSAWRLDGARFVRASGRRGGEDQAVTAERLPLSFPRLKESQVVRCRGHDVDGPLFDELFRSGLISRDAEGAICLPLVAAGDLLGVLVVSRLSAPRYSGEEVTLAQAIASHVAIAVANATLFERAQKVAAAEARQGIARDLHDSVSQTLFSLTLHARAAQAALRAAGLDDDHGAAKSLAEVAGLTRGALAETRALIFELRPEALAEEGLVAAVSKHAGALASREGLHVQVVGPDERLPLDPDSEEQLYRLIQEGLHNVVKHARAEEAAVVITAGVDEVSVAVHDEGVGFDPTAKHPGHLGLVSMHERAGRLGGRLHILSSPGAGTTITVTIPAGDRREERRR